MVMSVIAGRGALVRATRGGWPEYLALGGREPRAPPLSPFPPSSPAWVGTLYHLGVHFSRLHGPFGANNPAFGSIVIRAEWTAPPWYANAFSLVIRWLKSCPAS